MPSHDAWTIGRFVRQTQDPEDTPDGARRRIPRRREFFRRRPASKRSSAFALSGVSQRQADPRRSASALPILQRKTAALELGEAMRDGESESGAPGARGDKRLE